MATTRARQRRGKGAGAGAGAELDASNGGKSGDGGRHAPATGGGASALSTVASCSPWRVLRVLLWLIVGLVAVVVTAVGAMYVLIVVLGVDPSVPGDAELGAAMPTVAADNDHAEWIRQWRGHGEANWAEYLTSPPGAAGPAAPPEWRDTSGTPAAEPIMNCSSHYVTVRDGVRLAVDVCLPHPMPPGATALPALVQQTRYYRSAKLKVPFLSGRAFTFYPHIRPYLVSRGYAWVGVDVRGTGASGGSRQICFSADEIADGSDVVDWIVAQPWCDGNVAAIGISYDSIAAEHLAASGHPNVRAVLALFGPMDLYSEYTNPGGSRLSWFTKVWGAANKALDSNRLHTLIGSELGTSLWARAARSVLQLVASIFVGGVYPVPVSNIAGYDAAAEGDAHAVLATAVAQHSDNWDVHVEASMLECRDDRVNGKTIDSISPFSRIRGLHEAGIPVYSHSGWLDGANAHAAVKRFLTLSRLAEADGTTARERGHKLTLGPWQHAGAHSLRHRGSAEEAAFDHRQEAARFLDQVMKGVHTGVHDEEPVHYYTVGAERWNAADTFPPRPAAATSSSKQAATAAEPSRLYFHRGHRMDAQRLIHEHGADVFEHGDVGAGDASRWNTLVYAFNPVSHPHNQRAHAGSQGAFYTSPTLDANLEVTGFPILNLLMRFDCDHADVHAYLEDVHPDGHIAYVTEGILRAAFHHTEDPGPNDGLDGLRGYVDDPTVPYRSFRRREDHPEDVLEAGPAATVHADHEDGLHGHSVPAAGGADDDDHDRDTALQLRLHMLPVSYMFHAGHRVQVTIAPTDTDHFEDLCRPTAGQRVPRYVVFTGTPQALLGAGSDDVLDSRASWLDLPVVLPDGVGVER